MLVFTNIITYFGFRLMLDGISKEIDVLLAVGMAMILSVLRVLIDKPDTSPARIFLESLICGFLTLGLTFLILALDQDMRLSVFVGACVGYLGPTTMRLIAIRVINKRL